LVIPYQVGLWFSFLDFRHYPNPHCWRFRIFDFHPMRRAASAMWRITNNYKVATSARCFRQFFGQSPRIAMLLQVIDHVIRTSLRALINVLMIRPALLSSRGHRGEGRGASSDVQPRLVSFLMSSGVHSPSFSLCRETFVASLYGLRTVGN
jgi:hypothetical protein